MVDRVKVLIAERNSVELAYSEEYDLKGANIYFNAAGFVADNVKDAILEASTGGDPRPCETVNTSDTLTINSCRHHIVMSQFTNNGTIVNNGTLGVI